MENESASEGLYVKFFFDASVTHVPFDWRKTVRSARPSPSTSALVRLAGGGGGGVVSVAANWPWTAVNTLDVTASHFFSTVLAALRGLKLPSLFIGSLRSGRTSVVLVNTQPLSYG